MTQDSIFNMNNDTYKVRKEYQLRCGRIKTPDGWIIWVRIDGKDKQVLLIDSSDDEYFIVKDI